MPTDSFQGKRLEYNDTITYSAGIVAGVNPDAPRQPKEHGPYTGKIVDFTHFTIGVRADGWHGQAPLYYVYPSDVISAQKAGQIGAEEETKP